jgi:hypothetical protein
MDVWLSNYSKVGVEKNLTVDKRAFSKEKFRVKKWEL